MRRRESQAAGRLVSSNIPIELCFVKHRRGVHSGAVCAGAASSSDGTDERAGGGADISGLCDPKISNPNMGAMSVVEERRLHPTAPMVSGVERSPASVAAVGLAASSWAGCLPVSYQASPVVHEPKSAVGLTALPEPVRCPIVHSQTADPPWHLLTETTSRIAARIITHRNSSACQETRSWQTPRSRNPHSE